MDALDEVFNLEIFFYSVEVVGKGGSSQPSLKTRLDMRLVKGSV